MCILYRTQGNLSSLQKSSQMRIIITCLRRQGSTYILWGDLFLYIGTVICDIKSLCSRHGFTYIRGWMQMVLAPNDLFSWNNDTMSIILIRVFTLCLLSVMHINTYSVHNRFLKPWWGRLLCFCPSCHVFSPSLSKLNWLSLTPTGGPGPPTPRVASLPTGSAHSPFSGSRTLCTCKLCLYKLCYV